MRLLILAHNTALVCSRITCWIVALECDICCFRLLGHPIDMVQVARVPISTMGNPNLLLEFTNSAPLGRTARSKLVVFRGRWAKN